MRVKEINRLFESLERFGYGKKEVADCLSHIVAENPNFSEDEDSSVFQQNMEKYFPDPYDRASIMKRLLVSVCTEDEEDEEEESATKESNYYLAQMLQAISAMFEQTESFEEAKQQLSRLIDKQ